MRTRAALIGSLAIAVAVPLLAQTIPSASIEDKEMGWVKMYDFKGPSAPLKVDHRVYSPVQRTISMELANWMQASYSPIGGLGDVSLNVSEKLSPYNQNTAAAAQSYGAAGKIYIELKYGANRKVEWLTNSHLTWDVMVNGSFGLLANTLSTPERYYFTLPTFSQQGYGDELEKAVDLSGHPFLGQFPAWFERNSWNGNRKFVLLSKDRRLPFVKLTRGEYMDAVGVAITQDYDTEKKRITDAESGRQERIAPFMKYYEDRTAKRRALLEAARVKYKDRLQEVAEIAWVQPDIMLENFADVFEGTGGSRLRLPVYTVDTATLERSKSDTPQWVVVSWTANLSERVNKHLHDAILNQFNVEYIYNRFFDPEKVKGLPYAPLRPARAATVAIDASAAGRMAAADPTVYFFEDFSTTPVGKPPLNWHSNLDNTGAKSVVVELKGLEGHWASLRRFKVTPEQLKSPLPRDFTVSYDLVAARDYTWGARSMTFRLSNGVADSGKDSFFSVSLRPGFDARGGFWGVESKFPATPGYPSGPGGTVPGFSNTEQNNRIAVTIKKQGEMVQLFIGQAMIAEYPKAIPAALLFDAVSFDLQGQAGPNDQMFISNIKITKN